MPELKRNNHTVPKFYLRGFANESKELRRTPLAEPHRAGNVSISNATVLRDFYLLQQADGTLSDGAENVFEQIESEAARGFRSLIKDHEWPVRTITRGRIATWVALQHLRGPAARSVMGETVDIFVKMQIMVGGREALREVLNEGQATKATEVEVDAAWTKYSDTDSFQVQASPEEHIKFIRDQIKATTYEMFMRPWLVVDFENTALATCDHPVVLVPEADADNYLGPGFGMEGGIFIPLSRRVGLLLGEIQPARGEGKLGPMDARFDGTGDLVNAFNSLVIGNAREAVFTHPDDTHLTKGPLPRPRRQEVIHPDYEQWRDAGEKIRSGEANLAMPSESDLRSRSFEI